MIVGSSNGMLHIVSCTEGRQVESIQPTKSQAPITQMRLLSHSKVLVLTLHKFFIFDLAKKEVIKVLASAHKTSKDKDGSS